MLTRNVLYYGKDEPLPERIDLRAGKLRMVYENGDLRHIKYGSHEVLRRIYVAIRDQNWGTVLPIFSNVEMEIKEDSFRISYFVENRQGEIDFAWQGVITGTADGTISFTMDGEARSTFKRNRIGFCVLHPTGCMGAPCEVVHVDGTRERTVLPEFIVASQPVPPFAEMRSMAHEVESGTWAVVDFSGDIFEMEDQRNWTDASYKTFCTPLRLPRPVEILKGTRVAQSVILSFWKEEQDGAGASHPVTGQEPALAFLADPGWLAKPLPPIGLGVARNSQPLSEQEAERLKALHLHHLRVDLNLQQPDFPEKLAQAAAQARELQVSLEAAVFLQPGIWKGLESLAELVEKMQPPIDSWLVYPAAELFEGNSPVNEVVAMAHRALEGKLPGARFAAGTNEDFIFLQRSLPRLDVLNALTFSINPQVHAFDNTSIVETLEAQVQVAASAHRLASGLPVRVSPVTLKMRSNPYATGAAGGLKAGEIPPNVDVRQMSLFCAGWTVGSLNALASSEISSLTYFETIGWGGVMETQAGSPVPEVFQSVPGCVYPVYFVFALMGEFACGEVLPSHTTNGIISSSLLLRKGSNQRILLANHTEQFIQIHLDDVSGTASLRCLDETNAEAAMCAPEEFMAQQGKPIRAQNGRAEVTLLPFAIGWIDF